MPASDLINRKPWCLLNHQPDNGIRVPPFAAA
jgi:hypothetical protein